MKKILILSLSLLATFVVFFDIAHAAPVSNIFRSLIPETNDTYYIGTSTPSTNEWLGLYVKDINISGTCTGCGGGSLSGGTGGMLTSWVNSTTLTATSSPTAARFIATSTLPSLLPNATSTGITTTFLCLTGDTCRTTWPTGGSSASSTLLIDNNTFNASTTFAGKLNLQQASTTQFSSLLRSYFGSTGSTVIDNQGWIGISSSTPEAPLSIVQSAGLLTTALVIDGSANSAGAEMALNRASNVTTEANIDFNTGNVEKWQLGMQNNSSNDFELWDGLDNPIFAVSASNNDFIIGTTSGSAEVTIWGDAGTGSMLDVVTAASTTVFTILNNGNAGFGTTSPYTTLSIASTKTGDDTPSLVIDGAATANGNGDLALNRAIGGTGESNIDLNSGGVTKWQFGMQNQATAGDDFEFDDGSGNLVMTILDKKNNVAIGTSTSASSMLTLGTSSAPQLALSDNNPVDNLFAFRAVGNSFFLSTSTAQSTSTTAAFTLDSNGFPTIAALRASSGSNCLQTDANGKITNTGSACGSGGGSAAWPFTTGLITYGTSTQATTTGEWFQMGLYASSTSQFDYASTTALTVKGNFYTNGPSSLGGSVNFNNNSATNLSVISGGSNQTVIYQSDTALEKPMEFKTKNIERMRIDGTGVIAMGTTTPFWELTVASSTGPQLALSDSIAADNVWTMRNEGGLFAISSSTALATSTTDAILIGVNGTSTHENGINILSGCFSVAGTCITSSAGGGSSAWPFTPNSYNNVANQSTTTPLWLKNTMILASTTNFTYASTTMLSITPNDLKSGSVSVGGAFNLDNSLNAGAGMVLFTSKGSGTSGRLLTVDCSNAAFDDNCVNIQGVQTSTSILNIQGAPASKGTVKIGANGVGDTNGSMISLDASTNGYQGMALFAKCSGQATSTQPCVQINDAVSHNILNFMNSGYLGLGTTTPAWTLTVASSSGPQIGLVDTTNTSNAWTLRNTGGTFYLASSTAQATSTTAAFSIGTATTTITTDFSIQRYSTSAFSLKDQYGTPVVTMSTASSTNNEPRFQIFGTSTPGTLFQVDQYGHLTASSTPGTPAVSSCGTGSPAMDVNSNDTVGGVTTGAAATTCTITFSAKYSSTPRVFVTGSSAVSFPAVTAESTTGFTIGISGAVTGDDISYWVIMP